MATGRPRRQRHRSRHPAGRDGDRSVDRRAEPLSAGTTDRPDAPDARTVAAAEAVAAGTAVPTRRLRFTFIDEFRGLVGVMMALGHAQYYMNDIWLAFDPLDPFFPDQGQFAIRYMGYLCAPGFLVMSGAMVSWAYLRRRRKGITHGQAIGDFVQRGLFLVAVQWLWVNASWSGFAHLRLDHLGIIATIGLSMILVALMARWRWWHRALVALGVCLVHPLLLRIPYDHDGPWAYPMQLVIDSGDFNKYPLLPWFALACVGSVMAHFWFTAWTDRHHPDERAHKSLAVGLALILVAWGLRDWGHPFANLFPHGGWFTHGFFLVQKYPPSLAHQFWFAGAVIAMVGLFAWVDHRWPVLRPLAVAGKVPLFFYCVHIPLLALVFRRLEWLPYRGGGPLESLLVWAGLLAVMWPLAVWFAGVKRRHRNWLVRMI